MYALAYVGTWLAYPADGRNSDCEMRGGERLCFLSQNSHFPVYFGFQ